MDLIGREAESSDIAARLGDGVRLVVIVGPGGIGKTTLARHVLARSDDAVGARRVAELGGIDRPDAVPGELAAQLGFPSFDALASADEAGVVLVDNCEHVLDAAADAIATLLERRPGIVVLATSRSPLDVPGESIVGLAPLALPAEGVSDRSMASVQLFALRARDAGVRIEEGDIDLVGAICRRLDGIPLAIELAAARLRTMSLGELANHLGEGIDILARPRHRGRHHHRSVRETIDWSLGLLDAADRVAFAWWGVCPGWFDMELAVALGGAPATDVAASIDRLVDASLLVVDHRSIPTRYRMLEPVRGVAVGELASTGVRRTALERLSDHLVAGALSRFERGRTTIGMAAAAGAIDRFEQIDVALRHCLADDEDPFRVRVLYAALWGIVQQARLDEVLALGEAVHRRWPDVSGRYGADAASVLATARLFSGDLEGARSLARDALDHEDESLFASVTARRALGHAARFQGDHADAAHWFEAAAAAGFGRDVPTLAVASVALQAQDVAALGRVDAALELVAGAATTAADLASPLTELFVRSIEASIRSAGDSAQRAAARELAAANLDAAERGRYPVATVSNLQTLTACALADGDLDAAAGWATRLVDWFPRIGPGDLRRGLELAAAVLAGVGDDEARHLAATAAALPDTGIVKLRIPVAELGPGRVLDRAGAQRLARARLEALAARPAGARQQTPPDAAPNEFLRVGDVWHVTFRDTTVAVTASKGMDDIARLLAEPGRDVHCVELAGAVVEQAETGAVIDVEARRAYEARIRELHAEIDEAEAGNDHGRAEIAQTEFDTLVDHLTAALGHRGRTRTTGGSAERARSMVTHRIRTALRRIADVHPAAGRHLTRSIATGIYCRYQPEDPVDWVLRPQRPSRPASD